MLKYLKKAIGIPITVFIGMFLCGYFKALNGFTDVLFLNYKVYANYNLSVPSIEFSAWYIFLYLLVLYQIINVRNEEMDYLNLIVIRSSRAKSIFYIAKKSLITIMINFIIILSSFYLSYLILDGCLSMREFELTVVYVLRYMTMILVTALFYNLSSLFDKGMQGFGLVSIIMIILLFTDYFLKLSIITFSGSLAIEINMFLIWIVIYLLIRIIGTIVYCRKGDLV